MCHSCVIDVCNPGKLKILNALKNPFSSTDLGCVHCSAVGRQKLVWVKLTTIGKNGDIRFPFWESYFSSNYDDWSAIDDENVVVV